tara:strand:+ start:1566 stop:1790 length:225 start_codon:yes stop_codon:yes gene_type:complete
MKKEWDYDGTKEKKAWSIGVVSCMSKFRRYLTGAMIGMCFECVYRVESEVWYLPLSIGILMSIAMIVDVITDYR